MSRSLELLKQAAGIQTDAPRDEQTWNLLDRRKDKKGETASGEVVILSEGAPYPTRLNLRTVLQNDPAYNALRFNEFSGMVEWEGRDIADHLEEQLALDVASRYRFELAARTVASVAALVARERAYHPVRDYLRSLTWDGVARHTTWLRDYLGADQSPLLQELGPRWFTSCVARVLLPGTEGASVKGGPGCKVDTVLVLAGDQGKGKSTALNVLARGWFADTTLDLKNKDALMALQGVWLYEFAELDSMRRRDAQAVKAFLSAKVDRFRPPYGRHMINSARQCIVVGTTNEQVFLNDATGSRRFWPVVVGSIDLQALRQDRDQLWAEAVARYDEGQSWWLSEEMEAQRSTDAEVHTFADPWEGLIAGYKPDGTRGWVTISELLEHAVKKDPDRWTRADEMRIAGLLSAMGYERGPQTRWQGARVRPWVVPT